MPVPTGVVQALNHPPFGVLSRDTHPTTIDSTTLYIQRIRGPVNVDAFGISFDFFTIPAPFGSTFGVVNRYETRILQWAAQYTDLTGHDVLSQTTDVYEEGVYYYFDDLFPTKIVVSVTLGCVVIPQWLVAV